MTDKSKSNLAKGQESFDATIGNSLVQFFNRNISEVPTEVGGPKFDLVPIKQQKDIMINAARMHAEQEYNRIMELVSVLQKQAQEIKRRLDLTDMVHAAHFNFKLYHGKHYWLVYEHNKNRTILTDMGPDDWFTGKPEHYEYICKIKWLGDNTWIEIKE